MAVTQNHKMHLNEEVGRGQGYLARKDIIRAANRALRWVRSTRNQGFAPPRHIAQKMLLIGVTSNA